MLKDVNEGNYNLLIDYFHVLEQTFINACDHLEGGQHNYSFLLANHNVVISTAGKKLQDYLCKPFSHLPPHQNINENSLQILVWDEKNCGVKLPIPPWQWPVVKNAESVSQFSLKHYRVVLSENQTVFFIYDIDTNIAIVCIKDAEQLPNYFLSQPFFRILKLWAKQVNLTILHAGCIADDKQSVLLVGKGGSGKSTSSLQSLIGGLNYISDDYVLVSLGDNPVAYSIYCSGKLHLNHLKHFPQLEQIAIRGKYDKENKPILYLNELFKGQIINKSPIKAIVTPNVISNEKSTVDYISSFEALKALAPSTLIQLNLGDEGAFAKMADLTKTLACFRLNLGSDFTTIAPIIKSILNSL
jgi:hypothetical protein